MKVDDIDLFSQPKDYGFLPGNNPQGLIGGIQKQRRSFLKFFKVFFDRPLPRVDITNIVDNLRSMMQAPWAF